MGDSTTSHTFSPKGTSYHLYPEHGLSELVWKDQDLASLAVVTYSTENHIQLKIFSSKVAVNVIDLLLSPPSYYFTMHVSIFRPCRTFFRTSRRGSRGASGAPPPFFGRQKILKNSFTLICNFTHKRLCKISVSGSLIASSTQ